MNEINLIALRIKDLLRKKNLQQKHLIVATQLKQQTINAILRGVTKNPKKSTLKKIADVLGTTEHFLRDGIDISHTTNGFYPTSILIIPWHLIKDFLMYGKIKNEDIEMFDILEDKVKVSPKSFCLEVKDDIMDSNDPTEISFPKGCIILVDPEVTPQSGNSIIAFNKETKQETFQQYIIAVGIPYLRCLNKQFTDIKKYTEQDYSLIGTVVYRGFRLLKTI